MSSIVACVRLARRPRLMWSEGPWWSHVRAHPLAGPPGQNALAGWNVASTTINAWAGGLPLARPAGRWPAVVSWSATSCIAGA